MEILDYVTAGGKNVITEYLNSLPNHEKDAGYQIREVIEELGLLALASLKTRQLKGKLWEIKFSQNRIMYVIKDENFIYFLHACQKQKNKVEKFELKTAIRRAKENGIKI